jgi:ACS family D-galactonate transporter-like MFS transporter
LPSTARRSRHWPPAPHQTSTSRRTRSSKPSPPTRRPSAASRQHTTYSAELGTAAEIDPATKAAFATDPTDKAAQAKAVTAIALAFNIPPGDAVERLTALAAVPAADLKLLSTRGAALQDPKVQASLVYLWDHGADLKAASSAAPHQWQRFFWITVGGQLVFLPLIFGMAGGWNPRKARRQAARHEAWVRQELATARSDTPELQQV